MKTLLTSITFALTLTATANAYPVLIGTQAGNMYSLMVGSEVAIDSSGTKTLVLDHARNEIFSCTFNVCRLENSEVETLPDGIFLMSLSGEPAKKFMKSLPANRANSTIPLDNFGGLSIDCGSDSDSVLTCTIHDDYCTGDNCG